MQGKLYSTSTLQKYASESNRRMMMEHGGSLKRVYQLWSGNNIFCLGGRLIFGPDYRSILLTISLITVPVILFTIFICKRLANEVDFFLGNLVLSISIILCVYVITLLILTSSGDPGIVPRNPHPPEPEDDGGPLSPWTTGSQPGMGAALSAPPPTKDILINGIIVKVKYCNTCMLYRPPRCSHCSICNNCVERFDHHCPWVGQCIGKRNYRFFFMFVSATTLLCLYVFAFCWVNLVKLTKDHNCTLWRAFLHSPISALLIVYTFIGAWFVGGLTTFHLYLICTNQTTYENFRYRYDGKSNPYNKGCMKNLIEILFSKTPKSKIDLRAKIYDESIMFASSHSLEASTVDSAEVAKTSFDLEIAVPADKRMGVLSEEFDDIHAQIENLGKLERCGTQPRRMDTSWEARTKNGWEMKDDMEALALEFGMEYGYADRERNSREFL
ncbi:putative protein S-acyltransferase 7 [Carex rostrata]